jgi:L-amino acid N-acyltransferase YncA
LRAGAPEMKPGRHEARPPNPAEPTIRQAATTDAAAIAAIYAPYVRDTAISFEIEPPAAEVIAQRLARTLETHPWFVAAIDGLVLGYAYAGKHRERPAYRWSVDVTVYVDGANRRRGVGRSLYAALLKTLRRQGFRSAFAEITLPNPGSVQLHEVAGFRPAGVHVGAGFKLGCWHDVGYWRLALTDATEAPDEPIPFPVFRQMPGFAVALSSGSPQQ